MSSSKIELFDAEWYLSKYKDVLFSGIEAFKHYELIGKKLNRCPSGNFDPIFYAANNPDVTASGMDLAQHYLHYGIKEGRIGIKPQITNQKLSLSVSIVVPTYNRARALPIVAEKIKEYSNGVIYELIFINDGSTDDTEEVLKKLSSNHQEIRWASVENCGAGTARNIGADLSRHDLILFIGDDIIPADNNFLKSHIVYHQLNQSPNFAVLGKVVWPDDYFLITPVMEHIQGPGGEQFGYTDMMPFRNWDWRFFYTCNVSVKRVVVNDWLSDGFCKEFSGCGFEDGEFAYRMSKKYGDYNIFYIDDSIGYHYHYHNVRSFLKRQYFAGAMAEVLTSLHPELIDELKLHEIRDALASDRDVIKYLVSNLSEIEFLYKWAEILEKDNLLGSEHWHKTLLHTIFSVSFKMGYLNSLCTPLSNYAFAVMKIHEDAFQDVNRVTERKNWPEINNICLA